MEGLRINRWEGAGGQLTVPGIGAVLGTIANWNLTRRGETRQGALMWDLHGVLSYVNETLYRALVEKGYPLRIKLEAQGRKYNVDFDPANLDITDNRIIVKEITLNVS